MSIIMLLGIGVFWLISLVRSFAVAGGLKYWALNLVSCVAVCFLLTIGINRFPNSTIKVLSVFFVFILIFGWGLFVFVRINQKAKTSSLQGGYDDILDDLK